MNKTFTDEAWDDYIWWINNDKRILKRINTLIQDIERNGVETGIGKPEALRYDLQGLWSRRIDDEHRLIYTVSEAELIIISCRYHYEK